MRICDARAVVSRVMTAAMVVGALTAAPQANALLRPVSLEELIDDADEVVVVVCQAKSCDWVNGNLVTSHDLRVSETLVGARRPGETIRLSLVGGDSPNLLPISQRSPELPTISDGEEMVLFLRDPSTPPRSLKGRVEAPPAPSTATGNSPVVVGALQGKWTIVTEKPTGTRRVIDPRAIGPPRRHGGRRAAGRRTPDRQSSEGRRAATKTCARRC